MDDSFDEDELEAYLRLKDEEALRKQGRPVPASKAAVSFATGGPKKGSAEEARAQIQQKAATLEAQHHATASAKPRGIPPVARKTAANFGQVLSFSVPPPLSLLRALARSLACVRALSLCSHAHAHRTRPPRRRCVLSPRVSRTPANSLRRHPAAVVSEARAPRRRRLPRAGPRRRGGALRYVGDDGLGDGDVLVKQPRRDADHESRREGRRGAEN